jgi:hypothetical protein
MLFHASIPALNPEHVARVLAELWEGAAYPFPSFANSFIVFAAAQGGIGLEVYPAGRILTLGSDETATATQNPPRGTETHVAIGVPKSIEDIEAIARREGWTCRVCDRGGFFQVVEVWVENRFMVEALTPEMQKAYVTNITNQNWEKTFGFSGPLPAVS